MSGGESYPKYAAWCEANGLPPAAPLSAAMVAALTAPPASFSVVRFGKIDWLVGDAAAQFDVGALDRLHHYDADRIGAADGHLIDVVGAFFGEHPGRWLPFAFRIDGKRVPVLGRITDGHVEQFEDFIASLRGQGEAPGEAVRDAHQRVVLSAGEDFSDEGVARIGRQSAGQNAFQAFAHGVLQLAKAAIKAAFRGGRK